MLPPGKPDLQASIVNEAKFEPSDIALVGYPPYVPTIH